MLETYNKLVESWKSEIDNTSLCDLRANKSYYSNVLTNLVNSYRLPLKECTQKFEYKNYCILLCHLENNISLRDACKSFENF